MNRNILIIALLFFSTFQLFSQEDTTKFDLNVGADIMSRYVWRGVDYGRSPSIQPFLALSAGKFELGSWGAYTTNGLNIQEIDLYLSYNLSESISFTFTDYFFPDDLLEENNYSNYNNDSTGHVFEALVSFTLPGKLPISVSGGTVIYGADKINFYEGNDLINDKLNYSTYLELGYSTLISGNKIETFIGFTTHNGLYGNDFGIVNFGIKGHKNMKISSDYSLSVSCSLSINPQKQNVFLVFGIRI